ncbi:DUF1127 domain-containing protein [Pseudomonas benzenivorans]|uniref:DUF1127 domain-containing protein n=1 Tax=Pseudomonas benzenivorans TaxID=556533 RepID=A0ABY5H2G5_9PSED|nr:DUF1127 domain-containing protein [Pseudomonas benzenivorans]UTW06052.1 DUF1127 domain-containing protein [Pseudomonas benzenivorans]
MERILNSNVLTRQPLHTHWLDSLHATGARWLRNVRTRRQLANLDERLLADAGITPSERRSELDKPFWQ